MMLKQAKSQWIVVFDHNNYANVKTALLWDLFSMNTKARNMCDVIEKLKQMDFDAIKTEWGANWSVNYIQQNRFHHL